MAAERVQFTKQDALEFLTDVIRTPIGDVDHKSRLCQERTYIAGQGETSVRVKMPGKLDAVKVPDHGLLTNIRVNFDADGDEDHKRQALTAHLTFTI